MWTFGYTYFEPANESLREALCTLGNGYFATRGAAPEAVACKMHYPGVYVAGVYNKLATNIAGRTIKNEDMVNCPNWTFLSFRIGNGEWFLPSESEILSFRQELDMYRGILKRRMRFRNRKGQITSVETTRLVHMEFPHLAAINYIITPENYSDWITVRSMLDGAVKNTGVERYRQLKSKHLDPKSAGNFAKNGMYLFMATNQSKIRIAEASKINVFVQGKRISPAIKTVTRRLMEGKRRIGQEFRFFALKKHPYEVQKIVSLYTSKDRGIEDPLDKAISSVKKTPKFEILLRIHEYAWSKLWDKFDIQIEGDKSSQLALRLHMFHLLQTASPHNIQIDAGFPARGLHGEAYRGHIFWDEIFIKHFYDFHLPEVSKALLLYRFRRLNKAREYAKKYGHKGAMYPWQSASSGSEETQILHLNPLSGRWGPDYSRFQRHISFALVYNIWQYWQTTNDFNFIINFGAEIILSIAQFGASLAKFSKKDNRYHTEKIMGPDEFHEKYPFSSKPGLRDNAYTNFMIVWTILKAKEIIGVLPDNQRKRIFRKIGLNDKELKRWDDIVKRMVLIINEKDIIAQFDGYFKLKELNWKEYLAEYGSVKIKRMDRILKAEGKSPDEYKSSKQADTLMIFYLFSLAEIKHILSGLGYRSNSSILRKNYEYYAKRTTHGSTLSKVVHCFIAHLLGKKEKAWEWFLDVLESDIYDTQRGTTPEGIHAGVMGGSIDIVMRIFAGVVMDNDCLRINPSLPEKWRKLNVKFFYKGLWYSLSINKFFVEIAVTGPKEKFSNALIKSKNKVYRLHPDKKIKIRYNRS